MNRVLLWCAASLLAMPGVAQDVSLDKKLGAENAAKVEQEMGIYQHDSLYRLVNSVGNKLVSRLRNTPFEFRFFLADSPEPNAFALPGGYVYVTRGILPLVQTEDELAGIMAHEIIHVTQRHSVKQMQKGLLTGILTVPGKLINTVTGTKVGNIINAPIEFSGKAFTAQYSRGHESEADEFGIQLMASAGYKPEALADALERLSKVVELLTNKAEKNNYFSDHPYTPKRVAYIRKNAPLYKPVNPAPVTASENEFLKNFERLTFGQNPEQGIFKDSLFVQPGLSFAWFTPPGWQTMNKPAVAGGFSENGDAIVTLRISDPDKTIRQTGDEAKEKASKMEGVTVEAAGDTVIHSFPAYRLRFTSMDKKEVAKVELIWIDYQGQVFQLAGVCLPSLMKPVHQSLCSFQKANRDQLDLVKLYQLHYVQSQNETLDQLSARTGNVLMPSLTAAINNLTPSARLMAGSGVKIVKSSPYLPKK